MFKTSFILTLLFFLISNSSLSSNSDNLFSRNGEGNPDSLERQILYNGRLWRNQSSGIDGNQFFLTPEFSGGSIKTGKYSFNNLRLRYDVYNDELLIEKDDGTIIQLNKEIVDSFVISANNKDSHFKKFDENSGKSFSGYVEILYDGGIKVYAKYFMEILAPSITGGLPKFNQTSRVYIYKGGFIYRTDSRKDLLELFDKKEEKTVIMKFIRSNSLRVHRGDPDSFRKVIEYYETINK